MNKAVEVNHLGYAFNEKKALEDLTFDMREGEIVGLLGPNGAGKTTTIRLINGIYASPPRHINVKGFDPACQALEIRRISGVLTETPAVYERLNAMQNLAFFGVLAGMPVNTVKNRAKSLLASFDLSDRASEPVRNYSKGMKQRLALARALIANPQLLFLDEPTSGLDPEAALEVHRLILQLRSNGKRSILICTHHLHEAENLCDRLVIINHGKVLGSGTLDELRKQVFSGLIVKYRFAAPLSIEQDLGRSLEQGILDVKRTNDLEYQVRFDEEASVPPFNTWLLSQGIQLYACQPQQPTLEDVYFVLQERAETR